MRTISKFLLVSSIVGLLAGTAAAQSIADLKELSPEDRRAYLESMSEDERAAMREKWRAEYDNLSDEEKQAWRKQRGDRKGKRDRDAQRERWESMSDEERAQAKERHQAARDARRQKWESMSEEERAAAKAKRKQMKGERGERPQRTRDAAEPEITSGS